MALQFRPSVFLDLQARLGGIKLPRPATSYFSEIPVASRQFAGERPIGNHAPTSLRVHRTNLHPIAAGEKIIRLVNHTKGKDNNACNGRATAAIVVKCKDRGAPRLS